MNTGIDLRLINNLQPNHEETCKMTQQLIEIKPDTAKRMTKIADQASRRAIELEHAADMVELKADNAQLRATNCRLRKLSNDSIANIQKNLTVALAKLADAENNRDKWFQQADFCQRKLDRVEIEKNSLISSIGFIHKEHAAEIDTLEKKMEHAEARAATSDIGLSAWRDKAIIAQSDLTLKDDAITKLRNSLKIEERVGQNLSDKLEETRKALLEADEANHQATIHNMELEDKLEAVQEKFAKLDDARIKASVDIDWQQVCA